MKKIYWILFIVAGLVFSAFTVTCGVFDSHLADLTIDWLAFIAGSFLVIEALHKIFTSKSPLLRDQLFRAFRVVIGTCVFTIHLLQFMRYWQTADIRLLVF